MRYGFIYGLKCPVTNGCRYVGQTRLTLDKRLKYHRNKCTSGKTHKDRWLTKLKRDNSINKVEIFLIERCRLENLNEREIFWIKFYRENDNDLTNIASGGQSSDDRSDETKLKISNSLRGRRTFTHTTESRRKISLSLMGKPGRNTGNRHTNETKLKISNTKKGTISWNATPIVQISMDGSIIKEWRSARHAADTLNLSQGNICSVINGKRKQCGKFKWILKDVYEKLERYS